MPEAGRAYSACVQHHEDAIGHLVAGVAELPHALALVVTGSVARGEERPDSDVDALLVATEDGYAEHQRTDRLSYVEQAPDFGEHMYFDIKVTSLRQLEHAVAAADDPMRASVLSARVAWSHPSLSPGRIAELLTAIVDPPEHRWTELQASFLAQVVLHGGYFLAQAEERGLGMLRRHASVHFAWALGRALLARNRVLYRGPKYLETQLAGLEDAPPDIAARLAAFVEDPTAVAARDLRRELFAMGGWPIAADATLARFVEDNELAWDTGVLPPEYR